MPNAPEWWQDCLLCLPQVAHLRVLKLAFLALSFRSQTKYSDILMMRMTAKLLVAKRANLLAPAWLLRSPMQLFLTAMIDCQCSHSKGRLRLSTGQ